MQSADPSWRASDLSIPEGLENEDLLQAREEECQGHVFKSCHLQASKEVAIQDASREAFMQLSKIYNNEIATTLFFLHPCHARGDRDCHIRKVRLLEEQSPIHFSKWICAADEAYERALEELDVLRGKIVDYEERYNQLA
uniref:Uncharacterized protein n=1 Tax=Oryza brachyantha TaxID=4533 RepID=J3NCQ1_ORYBR